ncbi:hypothetical protein HMPREF1865_00899 [Veillonella parvula]|nr:hypothetical protein HMPREF1865_00899 [Veillonella parvula]
MDLKMIEMHMLKKIFSLFQKKLGGAQLHLLHIYLKLDLLLIMQ